MPFSLEMNISLLIGYQQTDMVAEKRHETSDDFSVASLAKRMLQLFRDRLDQELRPQGVTSAQLKILFTLEQEPSMSGARIARTCMVTPQTAQVLIRAVETNGWITRTRHPENERILLATLTPSGKQILTQSRTAIGRIYGAMLKNFTATEKEALEQMLVRCADNLDSLADAVVDLAPSAGRRSTQKRAH
jgi:DNA-binding MarR family transcriptional regulator